jgi:hypothetical protein
MVESSNCLQLHYYFKDRSHSIDSVFRNECEKELLHIFKDISSSLEISIMLETEPTEEGGFKETWRFIGKNSGQITLAISLAAILLSRFPVENKELSGLQIENLKLDNELKRAELRKLNLDKIQEDKDLSDNKIKDSTTLVNKNYKIVWRKSNFYKKLKDYPKIESIEVQRLKDKTPVGPARKISRTKFTSFILQSDDLPDLEITKGIVDVISPAIKSGKFRWKGFHEKEIITFEMNDFTFRDHVMRGDVHFSNSFSIEAEMTQKRKIDQDGSIKITNTIVHSVKATIDNGKKIEF